MFSGNVSNGGNRAAMCWFLLFNGNSELVEFLEWRGVLCGLDKDNLVGLHINCVK